MNRLPAILPAVLLASCTQQVGPHPAMRQPHNPPQTTASDPASSTRSSPADSGGRLTATTALAWAWDEHPEMKRARAVIVAAHGRKVQAALWPNPRADLKYVEEEHDKRTVELTVAQKIELGGKLPARRAGARAAADLARSELLETWNEVSAEIQAAFVRLAYTRRRLVLIERLTAVERRELELSEGLWKAGKRSESEHLRIVQREAQQQALVRQSRSLLADAQRRLPVAVGIPAADAPSRFVCALDGGALPTAEFDALLESARTNSTVLATSRMRAALARAEYRLARTKRWSDVTIRAGVKHIDYPDGHDEQGLILGLSAEAPLWHRYPGDVSTARSRVRAAEHEQAAETLRIASRLSVLLADREKAAAREGALRDRLVPAAEKRSELAKQSLGAGKISEIEFLQRRREVLEARLGLLREELLEAIATIHLRRIARVASSPLSGGQAPSGRPQTTP